MENTVRFGDYRANLLWRAPESSVRIGVVVQSSGLDQLSVGICIESDVLRLNLMMLADVLLSL